MKNSNKLFVQYLIEKENKFWRFYWKKQFDFSRCYLMLTKMLNVNIRPNNLQRFSWFNMCEHPELGSFACDAGSGSKSCSSGISTLRTNHCAQVSAISTYHSQKCLDDLCAASRAPRNDFPFPFPFHPFCWSNFARIESPCLSSKYWRYRHTHKSAMLIKFARHQHDTERTQIRVEL